jgi:hypothetical protein
MTNPHDLLLFAIDHARCESYACDAHEYGCGAYHAMSPLLHGIGFFKSYELYPQTIRDAVAAGPGPVVAVAGVESELSAHALLRALPSEKRHAVTFFDRCETPLRRIAASAHPVGNDVAIVAADVLTGGLGERFDVVVADSFVKQFSHDDKPRALEQLRAATRSSSARVVLREYVGELGSLLHGFWSGLPAALDRSGLRIDAARTSFSCPRRRSPRTLRFGRICVSTVGPSLKPTSFTRSSSAISSPCTCAKWAPRT